MSETTVEQLATLVGIPAEQLLSQMAGAGIDKSSPDDVVTDDEKQRLLAHIRSGQSNVSAEPAKVTLRRKSTSTIKAGTGAVNVEVRKKRTYVKRGSVADEKSEQQEAEAEALGARWSSMSSGETWRTATANGCHVSVSSPQVRPTREGWPNSSTR